MKMNYLGNQSLCEVDMLLSRLDLSLDKQDLPGTPRHGQSHTDWFIIWEKTPLCPQGALYMFAAHFCICWTAHNSTIIIILFEV